MSKLLRDHLRSNVVGYVAVVLALSMGTAYATHPGGADTISSGDVINNEIRTADIKDANLTTADIRVGAVTTGKIADGEVRSADVLDQSLTGSDVDDGSLGAADLSAGVLGARAYGRVAANGTLTRSKNVDSVTNPFVSHYCIDPASGIDVDTAVLVVGQDYTGDDLSTAFNTFPLVAWASEGPFCPDETLEVTTNRYIGDDLDDDDGGGNTQGDVLSGTNRGFAFMIP